MDAELRVGLWNALGVYYWHHIGDTHPTAATASTYELCLALWWDYFKEPLDTLGEYWFKVHGKLRQYFFDCEWYEVYDFVEFVAQNHPVESTNEDFMQVCNIVMERERSAFRFVGGQITEITSAEEIEEIEEAIESSSSPKLVGDHLKSALTLLADRKTPDYRNSIKESISAVEAICNTVAGSSSATLGQALKALEKKNTVELHPALKDGFIKLYGCTSDADGIRHALLKESNLDFEDAKFMLVSCSAFVNYLTTKSVKAGVEL